jgi:hypothetical protein
MNKGMTETVTARITKERQSAQRTQASKMSGAMAARTAVGR